MVWEREHFYRVGSDNNYVKRTEIGENSTYFRRWTVVLLMQTSPISAPSTWRNGDEKWSKIANINIKLFILGVTKLTGKVPTKLQFISAPSDSFGQVYKMYKNSYKNFSEKLLSCGRNQMKHSIMKSEKGLCSKVL